jgi:hypothetical protein
MALRLPPFHPLPPPKGGKNALLEVPIQDLHPTQLCVGMAEIVSRQRDFAEDDPKEQRQYLKRKPTPLVRSAAGELWMVDRHHRLRALLELDPQATAFGYVALEVDSADPAVVLAELQRRGWLYLYDGRGLGPQHPSVLPPTLLGTQDDPYRTSAPLIPFHEFRWGAWLRSRQLPPFSSAKLEPALPAARALARSQAASRLAGWIGPS